MTGVKQKSIHTLFITLISLLVFLYFNQAVEVQANPSSIKKVLVSSVVSNDENIISSRFLTIADRLFYIASLENDVCKIYAHDREKNQWDSQAFWTYENCVMGEYLGFNVFSIVNKKESQIHEYFEILPQSQQIRLLYQSPHPYYQVLKTNDPNLFIFVSRKGIYSYHINDPSRTKAIPIDDFNFSPNIQQFGNIYISFLSSHSLYILDTDILTFHQYKNETFLMQIVVDNNLYFLDIKKSIWKYTANGPLGSYEFIATLNIENVHDIVRLESVANRYIFVLAPNLIASIDTNIDNLNDPKASNNSKSNMQNVQYQTINGIYDVLTLDNQKTLVFAKNDDPIFHVNIILIREANITTYEVIYSLDTSSIEMLTYIPSLEPNLLFFSIPNIQDDTSNIYALNLTSFQSQLLFVIPELNPHIYKTSKEFYVLLNGIKEFVVVANRNDRDWPNLGQLDYSTLDTCYKCSIYLEQSYWCPVEQTCISNNDACKIQDFVTITKEQFNLDTKCFVHSEWYNCKAAGFSLNQEVLKLKVFNAYPFDYQSARPDGHRLLRMSDNNTYEIEEKYDLLEIFSSGMLVANPGKYTLSVVNYQEETDKCSFRMIQMEVSPEYSVFLTWTSPLGIISLLFAMAVHIALALFLNIFSRWKEESYSDYYEQAKHLIDLINRKHEGSPRDSNNKRDSNDITLLAVDDNYNAIDKRNCIQYSEEDELNIINEENDERRERIYFPSIHKRSRILEMIIGVIWASDHTIAQKVGYEAYYYFKLMKGFIRFSLALTILSFILSAIFAFDDEKKGIGDIITFTLGDKGQRSWISSFVSANIMYILFVPPFLILMQYLYVHMPEESEDHYTKLCSVQVSGINLYEDANKIKHYFYEIFGKNNIVEICIAFSHSELHKLINEWYEYKRRLSYHLNRKDKNGYPYRARIVWWKFWHSKIDIISYYKNKLECLEELLYSAKNKGVNSGYCYVVFNCPSKALECVQHFEKIKGNFNGHSQKMDLSSWKVTKAPIAEDIIWKNLHMRTGNLKWRRFGTMIIFVIFSIITCTIAVLDTVISTMSRSAELCHFLNLEVDSLLCKLLHNYPSQVFMTISPIMNLIIGALVQRIAISENYTAKSYETRSMIRNSLILMFLNSLFIPILMTSIVFSPLRINPFSRYPMYNMMGKRLLVMVNVQMTTAKSIFIISSVVFPMILSLIRTKRAERRVFPYNQNICLATIMTILGFYSLSAFPMITPLTLLYLIISYFMDKWSIMYVHAKNHRRRADGSHIKQVQRNLFAYFVFYPFLIMAFHFSALIGIGNTAIASAIVRILCLTLIVSMSLVSLFYLIIAGKKTLSFTKTLLIKRIEKKKVKKFTRQSHESKRSDLENEQDESVWKLSDQEDSSKTSQSSPSYYEYLNPVKPKCASSFKDPFWES